MKTTESKDSPEDRARGPLLRPGQDHSWVTVDAELITWAKSVAINRATMNDVYHDIPGGENFVPCEADDCDVRLELGQEILVIEWKNDAGHQKRVFCSVTCQRRNRLETAANARIERKELEIP